MWAFYKALFQNPRAIGAAMPSSKRLAKNIAKQVPLRTDAIVIELGAGTGVITRALIEHGIADHLIVAVEASPHLAEAVSEKFPNIKVIQGNAINLVKLLGQQHLPINAIVSSLPLRSLPAETTQKIVEQIDQVMDKGSRYIQYTYSNKESIFNKISKYKKIYSGTTWLNLPPARIDVFEV